MTICFQSDWGVAGQLKALHAVYFVCVSKGSSWLCCEKHVEGGPFACKMPANLWPLTAPVVRLSKVTRWRLLLMPPQDKIQSAGVVDPQKQTRREHRLQKGGFPRISPFSTSHIVTDQTCLP